MAGDVEQTRDIVVIGASAGGVEALLNLTAGLPPDLPAALFVVLHTMSTHKTLLPEILSRGSRLPAAEAVHGQRIEPGHIYVAPSDQHLLVQRDRVELVRGPKVNGHRPAVDPLFRSAAEAFGPRVIGIVLTGGRDCGAAGLVDIKRAGGVTVIQDPLTAPVPEMPEAARSTGMVDEVLAIPDIAKLVARLAGGRGGAGAARKHGAGPEVDPLDSEHQAMSALDEREWKDGVHTDLSCPDCGGVLRQVGGGSANLLRFRCRIGHAMSAGTLDLQQSASVEAAVSAAMRLFAERADLCRRVGTRQGTPAKVRASFEERARRHERHRDTLQELLVSLEGSGPVGGGE